jgi:nitrile hydratase accessory protein
VTVDRLVAAMEELPRHNGELVFEEPWQGRAFGLVLAMHTAGAFEWGEFRKRLIDAIAAHDDDAYYDRWLEAFERLLVEQGLIAREEVEARAEALAEQDHGDDHHDSHTTGRGPAQ